MEYLSLLDETQYDTEMNTLCVFSIGHMGVLTIAPDFLVTNLLWGEIEGATVPIAESLLMWLSVQDRIWRTVRVP